jgi:hypothetical protein
VQTIKPKNLQMNCILKKSAQQVDMVFIGDVNYGNFPHKGLFASRRLEQNTCLGEYTGRYVKQE